MPMPGTAFLLLRDGDINPTGELVLHDPDELVQIRTGTLEVGDVIPIGQGQQVIGAHRQDELAYPGTGTSDRPVFMVLPIVR